MKTITNINELEDRRQEIEEAIISMPYSWEISPYGNLEHVGDSNIHCYQVDEAKRLVKALYDFYFPVEEVEIGSVLDEKHPLQDLLDSKYSEEEAIRIKELLNYFLISSKPTIMEKKEELKWLRFITRHRNEDFCRFMDYVELDYDLVSDYLREV